MSKPSHFSNMREEANAVLQQADLGTLDDYDIAYESPGQKSIVLFSKHDSDTVVKIPISGHSEASKFFEAETKNLKYFDALGIESVDIPIIRAIGHDPDYILMTRLGPALGDEWKRHEPSKDEITAVGRAIGEFIVELHEKTGGIIPDDFHFANMTRQHNGRYGCLDFESCIPGSYETALFKLAFEEINVLPAVSDRIRELTGKGLDVDGLRQQATDRVNKFWNGDPVAISRIERNCGEISSSRGKKSGPDQKSKIR